MSCARINEWFFRIIWSSLNIANVLMQMSKSDWRQTNDRLSEWGRYLVNI
jgi:hypothetical protein